MKIVLGIDLQQAYLPALQLLGCLAFKDAEIILVQTAPTIDSTLPAFPIDGATIDFVQSTFRDAAEKALASAKDEANALGMPTRSLFCVGPSGEILNETVEEESADLVAVRTTHLGAWESEFMGSVTRAVVLGGKVSVLIAKTEPRSGSAIDVVFAADGSEFNHRCVDCFVKLNPTGIGIIHVVCAWGLASQFEHLIRHEVQHSVEVDKNLCTCAECAADEIAAKLAAAGFQTNVRVGHGSPDQVLAEAMKETGAGLMVVGAHGKNWIERLLIGSTSLHQVVKEPYNVLVLRP